LHKVDQLNSNIRSSMGSWWYVEAKGTRRKMIGLLGPWNWSSHSAPRKRMERDGGKAHVVEHLPSKHEAPSSNHSTKKKMQNVLTKCPLSCQHWGIGRSCCWRGRNH
jgi:hypothetical protein